MNLRLAAISTFLPHSIRKSRFRELFQLTAKAFGAPMPDLDRISDSAALRAYADFTRDLALKIPVGGLDRVKQKLFEGAYGMGAGLRKQLHVTSAEESLRAARVLYRALGIDFRWREQGEVTIATCYFSRFYSGQVCRLISSIDEGLIAGLTEGGRLSFRARITEGNRCCLANIRFKEEIDETGDRGRFRCRWCSGSERTSGTV